MSIEKDLKAFKVKIKAIQKFLKEIYQNYRSPLRKAKGHSPKAFEKL